VTSEPYRIPESAQIQGILSHTLYGYNPAF
jgi:hypothetical protein